MKKIFLLMMLLATVFVACSDDDDEKDSGTPWEIKMTVEVEEEGTVFTVHVTDKNHRPIVIESIDWGDNNIEENIKNLEHHYSSGIYNITVKGNGGIHWECTGQNITALDVTRCTTLIGLSCNYNQLTSLDVSKCTELLDLFCASNQLTELNVTGCKKLSNLTCANNQLTALYVTVNSEIRTLDCNNNQLISLAVTGCTNLSELHCNGNQLSALPLSGCHALLSLHCGDNNFDNNAMNTIYNNLPDRTGEDAGRISFSQDDAKGDITIAKNKNWKIETGFN